MELREYALEIKKEDDLYLLSVLELTRTLVSKQIGEKEYKKSKKSLETNHTIRTMKILSNKRMTKLSEVLPKHIQDQCKTLLDITENKPINEENVKLARIVSEGIATTIALLLREESNNQ